MFGTTYVFDELNLQKNLHAFYGAEFLKSFYQLSGARRARVGTSRYFAALTAKRGPLCQNDEKIFPSFKPYRLFENIVGTTGSLRKA